MLTTREDYCAGCDSEAGGAAASAAGAADSVAGVSVLSAAGVVLPVAGGEVVSVLAGSDVEADELAAPSRSP